MKRSEIRTFVKEGVNALSPAITHGSGLYTFFNSNRAWEYPIAFHETIGSSGNVGVGLSDSTNMPLDGWNVKIWIAQLTKLDAVPDDYEPLIDQCDEIAQKLTYQFNQALESAKLVTLTGLDRTPFVKKNADILCGVILTFTINSPDKTNVC